jgi:hypothetical protein
LEQRYRRSIEIKLSGDSLFSLRRFVSKNFFVRRSLKINMTSSRNRFRSWDVSVWVNILGLLRRLSRSVQELTVTVFLNVFFLG